MKCVLLCWELGGGIGYTAWLIEIARALQARGCSCMLALRELVPCVHQFAFLEAPVVAAPVAPGLRTERIRREGFNPVSFAAASRPAICRSEKRPSTRSRWAPRESAGGEWSRFWLPRPRGAETRAVWLRGR